MDDQASIIGVARKIKKLRTERGYTMEKLADLANCSKAYISQIEKGLVQPSVSILSRLASALEVSVSEIFRDTSIRDNRQWKLRKAERRKIHYPDGKVVSHLLTKGVFSKKMQPLLSIIQPQGSMGSEELLSHPLGSEEFVLVLKGEIHFKIGDEEILLGEGDTIYFNGDLPHRWVNNSNKNAEHLFVWTPPVW